MDKKPKTHTDCKIGKKKSTIILHLDIKLQGQYFKTVMPC